MTYSPCPQCHRHVRSNEAACVFCGTSLRAPEASLRGGLSSAALVSVAAMALMGCEPKVEPPTAPVMEAPSSPVAPSASAATPLPSATAVVTAPPTAVPSSTTASPPTESPIRPAMRYGIAPNRKPQ